VVFGLFGQVVVVVIVVDEVVIAVVEEEVDDSVGVTLRKSYNSISIFQT